MAIIINYSTILEIHDRYIKCIQIKHSARKYSVLKSVRTEIANGNETDDIAYIVKSLLKEMDIFPPKNLIALISGRDASIRLIDLPLLTDKGYNDLDEMVKYQLMPNLPINIEQMCYDYQIVGWDSTRTKVLTASAKRTVINKILNTLSSADADPELVTVSSFVLFNSFVIKDPDSMRYGAAGIIYLRDSGGEIVISEDGYLVYARNFQISPGKDQIIREISNSFSRSSIDIKNLNTIHLIIEDEMIPELKEKLYEAMPDANWKTYSELDDLTYGMAAMGIHPGGEKTLSASYGQGIKSLALIRINLLRQIFAEKKLARKGELKARLIRLYPAFMIIALLLISAILGWQVHNTKISLKSIEDDMQANEERNALILKLKDTEKKLNAQIKSLSWTTDSYPMVSYRLYIIAKSIPNDIRLKEVYIPEIKIDKKKQKEQPISRLNVVGYAREQIQIESFIENLRRYDCFSDVRQESSQEVSVSGEKLLEFGIGLISEP